MTKNQIKNRLEQMQKAYEAINVMQKKLWNDISKSKELEDVEEDQYDELRRDVEGYTGGSFDDILKSLESYGLEEGEKELPLPYFVPREWSPDFLEIAIPLNETGDKFVLSSADAQEYTMQASLAYQTADGTLIDIALAERKRGELSVISGKKPDNEDVDLYTYQDPTTEDWQNLYTLKYEDLHAENI